MNKAFLGFGPAQAYLAAALPDLAMTNERQVALLIRVHFTVL